MGSRFRFVGWLRRGVVTSRILGSGRSVSRGSITGYSVFDGVEV